MQKHLLKTGVFLFQFKLLIDSLPKVNQRKDQCFYFVAPFRLKLSTKNTKNPTKIIVVNMPEIIP